MIRAWRGSWFNSARRGGRWGWWASGGRWVEVGTGRGDGTRGRGYVRARTRRVASASDGGGDGVEVGGGCRDAGMAGTQGRRDGGRQGHGALHSSVECIRVHMS